MRENEIAKTVVDCAIEVHRTIGGPGLLEGVYEEALAYEIRSAGLRVERQIPQPIVYKSQILGTPLRLDLRVEGLVLIDTKATIEFHPVFVAQMLTYLRLSGLKLGLVINFGERFVKDGIHRVVNGLQE
jgi:GxxExxY protein